MFISTWVSFYRITENWYLQQWQECKHWKESHFSQHQALHVPCMLSLSLVVGWSRVSFYPGRVVESSDSPRNGWWKNISDSFSALLLNTSVGKAEEGSLESNNEIKYRKWKARVQIGFIKADELIFSIFTNIFNTFFFLKKALFSLVEINKLFWFMNSWELYTELCLFRYQK